MRGGLCPSLDWRSREPILALLHTYGNDYMVCLWRCTLAGKRAEMVASRGDLDWE